MRKVHWLRVILLGTGLIVSAVRFELLAQDQFKIVKEWKGGFSGVDKPAQVVIRDAKTWADWWDKVHSRVIPKPELPEVDFTKHMVVAVFMGMRSTGGYAIRITDVRWDKAKDKLQILVQEISPAPGAIVTQALTQPYHIVVIPRTEKTVEFILEKITGK
ncbi:MAG: protease complex subunit PrcB family protein [Gemmatales bacterium]|nr:protease complex subunit PrcB family protein [Gemmatales bacterium]MDW7994370.1 protease complex subunit PrcB family protein [Gemmatales bacterium]